MKITCINEDLSAGFIGKLYGECEELSEYDIKDIPEGVEEFWYWYNTAPYEGYGHCIFRIGNRWQEWGLDHCSCYGPLENILLRKGVVDVQELLENCSEHYKSEIEPLVVKVLKEERDGKNTEE